MIKILTTKSTVSLVFRVQKYIRIQQTNINIDDQVAVLVPSNQIFANLFCQAIAPISNNNPPPPSQFLRDKILLKKKIISLGKRLLNKLLNLK